MVSIFKLFGVYVVKRHCVDRGVKFGVYLKENVVNINEMNHAMKNGVLFGRLLQKNIFHDYINIF